jgi:predicted nicotinamide N-methyase
MQPALDAADLAAKSSRGSLRNWENGGKQNSPNRPTPIQPIASGILFQHLLQKVWDMPTINKVRINPASKVKSFPNLTSGRDHELTVKESFAMRYRTKIDRILIPWGDPCSAGYGNDPSRRIELEIESIADFNQAIDDMFAELEARGEQDLLSELCPYFGTVWASGRALAEVLAVEPAKAIEGLSFLEIGCGLAVPSMVLVKRGAGRVMATDMHPDVGDFIVRNFRRNGLLNSAQFTYRRVDWRAFGKKSASADSPKVISDGRFPDVLVASDVLYDRGQAEQVASFLVHLMAAGTRRALITDPGRPYLQDFVTLAEQRGLELRIGSRVVADPSGEVSVFVLDFSMP